VSTLPLTTVEKTAERTRRGLAKCVILMPVGGAIEPGCEESLRRLEQRGYPVWRVCGYSAIDAARNQIATDALASLRRQPGEVFPMRKAVSLPGKTSPG